MFKELVLKPSYYSTSDNIAKEFYNPVLQISHEYYRVSAYFSSKALSSYSQGLIGLVKNNGKMQLIVSIEISVEDFEEIKKGYNARESFKTKLLAQLDEKLSIQEQANFSNLAYLIANSFVDVKIGFCKKGIFHSKFGICKDTTGNIIYFSGSNNETDAAINANYEAFDVTASWLSSDFDRQKIIRAEQEFYKLWNCTTSDDIVYVKDINEVVIKKIISVSKGKLIMNPETMIDDALILSYEDGGLKLYDNLKSYIISHNDLPISQKLVPYYEDEYPNFSQSLTYIEIKEVISILEKYAKRKKFEFIVTDALKNYLLKVAYFIEERSDLGTAIKYYENDLDPIIEERFNAFSAIVSQELDRSLRSKQMWSAFFMHEMKHAANFSVPGSGKTSMIYGTFAYLSSTEIDKVNKIVMIGPKNSFLAWKDEFGANFGSKRELKELDIHVNNYNEFELQLESGDRNLILINYEALPKYETALKSIIDSRTMIVFDEVHKIKGLTSIRAQAALRISENAGYKYVLTGTPIPNTYEDIYNFLNILYGDEYDLYFNFRKNELKTPSPNMVDTINKKLYPFFWRTNKKELDVPPVNEDMPMMYEATDEEQEIINLLYRKYRNPLILYIRLIQASTNPKLILNAIDAIEMYGEENNPFTLDSNEEAKFTEEEIQLIRQVNKTTKYNAAIDLATNLYEENKQSIMWCMFVDTINSVERDLLNQGIRAKAISGSTPQKEREDIIRQFKRQEIDVLVTNPHTLAESVSLHHTCHDAIYLEYSFNLTHMLQSRDRIHRLGLKETDYTQYYYFMLMGQEGARNTVDERIYLRLKEKEMLMIRAIEGDLLIPDPEVSIEEIYALFD